MIRVLRFPRLLLSLLPFLHSAWAAETITNNAGLAALPDSEIKVARQFQIRGTTHSGGKFPVIDDGTVPLPFKGFIPEDLPAGARVAVSGFTELRDSGERVYIVSNLVITGHAPVPEPVTADCSLFDTGIYDYRRIRLKGLVADVFPDEIDADYTYFTFCSGDKTFCATIGGDITAYSHLSGADVEITGLYSPHSDGRRPYLGRRISISAIKLLRPAATSPYEFPKLEPLYYKSSPDTISGLGRRQLSGTVVATWGKGVFLLEDQLGLVHKVHLTDPAQQPVQGDRVTIGGFPRTDVYNINFRQAICTREGRRNEARPRPKPTNPDEILHSIHRGIDTDFHGKRISISGVIVKPSTSTGDGNTLYLDCGTHVVPVVRSGFPDESKTVDPGTRLTVAGTCVMDVDDWQPLANLPRIKGFFLVVNSSEDIEILALPPWWTPTRLKILIGSILLVLAGIVIWNRVLLRIIRRKSQDLFDEQIAHVGADLKLDERTRLAVELHDSLSQSLAGLACQIVAAKNAVGTDAVSRQLDTAERMLLSCRTELKRCLYDLRGDALDDQDMSSAVTKTVSPVIGDAELVVRFNVPRTLLLDSTAHTILCIARELSANAVRHGKATRIRIAGECHDGILSFSVRDNGCGFDTEDHPGPGEGHFGLEGIRERIEKIRGRFLLESTLGTGTRAEVSLTLPKPIQEPNTSQ